MCQVVRSSLCAEWAALAGEGAASKLMASVASSGFRMLLTAPRVPREQHGHRVGFGSLPTQRGAWCRRVPLCSVFYPSMNWCYAEIFVVSLLFFKGISVLPHPFCHFSSSVNCYIVNISGFYFSYSDLKMNVFSFRKCAFILQYP